MAQWVKNLTAANWVTAVGEDHSPAWHSGLKDLALHSCGAGHSYGSIQSLAHMEFPYAMGAVIKFKKIKFLKCTTKL